MQNTHIQGVVVTHVKPFEGNKTREIAAKEQQIETKKKKHMFPSGFYNLLIQYL